MDISRIQVLLAQTREAIARGDRELAERVGWDLAQACEKDYDVKTEEDYTPPLAKLQYEVMSVMLDLHIMRGDPIDIAIRGGQILKKFKDDYEHLKNWTKEDWRPIVEIVIKTRKATDDYFYRETIEKRPKEPERTPECQCLLCRKNKADKTGSHLVPHLLIGQTFSYDGSDERDKVIVEEASLAGGARNRYFGRQVYDDTVQELLGRSFTDDELESEIKKPNALTRDYVFCHDCEDRFGVIESYYAEIKDDNINKYSTQVPYLFWLSVAWRMSVGGMGFKMTTGHEEKLRKVLDRALALKREDLVLEQSKLGHCAYTLQRANDTRDETLGILAVHTPTKPYLALIGNLLFRFFTSESAAISFGKKNGWTTEELNTGRSPEKVTEISFIDFWRAKREILDANYEDERDIWNLGQPRNKTLSRYEAIRGDAFDPEYNIIPNWLNTYNDRVMMEPRAVRKIREWCEKNPDSITVEALSAGTGYSLEELAYILHYWKGKCKEQEKKQKRTQKMAPMMDYLLDLF